MYLKILFSGGGTAGHINPAVAIAKYIREQHPGWDILFVGTQRGLEKNLVPQEGFEIRFVEIEGLKRKLSLDNLKTIKYLMKGICQSRKILKEYKPDIVIGTGGYVCAPVVLSASFMKIPTLIHEQNVFPGITVKLLSRFVSSVAISFEESKKYLKPKHKLILTGNPIRQEILHSDYAESRKKLKLDDRPFILAFGGSLGAEKINETMCEVIGYIAKENKYQLTLGTGQRQYNHVMDVIKQQGIHLDVHSNIRVVPYIYNMHDLLSAADIVISRAGAITVSELTALGKPAILIPSPNVTHNHQEYNARALEKQGAAVVLTEDKLSGKVLYEQIKALLEDKEKLKNMRKNSLNMGITNSTEKIYNIVMELIK